MSTSSPAIDWQRNYDRDKKERTRPNAQRRYPRERIQNLEMWECNWWEVYRIDAAVKKSSSSQFQLSTPLIDEQVLQDVMNGRLFLYVQCKLKVSDLLNAYFANFPQIFKNAVVSKNDIGDLMEEYAKKEGILSQPRRMLKSSFHLKKRVIITPLLLHHSHLGLECTKIHQSVQHTPKKCFNSFVQPAVNARRQADENPTQGYWLK